MATRKGKLSWLEEDDDEPVVIKTREKSMNDKLSCCLIGKLVTTKSINAFGLLETMRKIWKPTGGMTAKEIETNLFSFLFNQRRDMEKILSMELWHFDKNLLVLKKLEHGVQPSAMKFETTPFRVRIYDLPRIGREPNVIRSIGNKVGEVVEIDNTTLEGFDRSVRIKVMVNVTKPLKRGIKIKTDDGNSMWIPIMYERLPSFCYICGCVGHIKRDCSVDDEADEFAGLEDDELPYGDWLRASPMAKHARVVLKKSEENNYKEIRRPLFERNEETQSQNLKEDESDKSLDTEGVTEISNFLNQVIVNPHPKNQKPININPHTKYLPPISDNTHTPLQITYKIDPPHSSTKIDETTPHNSHETISPSEPTLTHETTIIPKIQNPSLTKSEHHPRHPPFPENQTNVKLDDKPNTQKNQHNLAPVNLDNQSPLACMEKFQRAVEDYKLSDLGFIGNRFTWTNGQADERNIMERLDRAFANEQWKSLFVFYQVQHLFRTKSDHCPVAVEFDVANRRQAHNRKRKCRIFRFERMWLEHEKCGAVIEDAWNFSPPMTHIGEKISFCAEALKSWDKREFGSVNLRINKLTEELKKVQGAAQSKENIDRARNLETKLQMTYKLEEIMWHQRSRMLWLKVGDRNTRFFHQKVSQRRKRNTIERIKNSKGDWCETEEEIAKVMVEYFHDMYKSVEPSDNSSVLDSVEPRPSGLLGSYELIPEDLKVCDLIDDVTGGWRINEVRRIFKDIDANRILKMHLSPRLPPDKHVWLHSKSGLLSVKSAYHWIHERSAELHTRPSQSTNHSAWRQIWNIRTIPKVKHFVWRACVEALPTKDGLLKRGVQVDPICDLCGEEPETQLHLFLECRVINQVWRLSPLRIDTMNPRFGSFKNFMWSVMKDKPAEFFELAAITTWKIWTSRNKACMEGEKFDVERVLHSAQALFLESHEPIPPRQSRQVDKKINRWKPSDEGTLKMNTDAATFKDGSVGFGFVIRDHCGDVLLAGSAQKNMDGNSTMIEGAAMLFAIRKALEAGITNFHIESDSKGLIDNLNGKTSPEMHGHILIEDILIFAKIANCSGFCYAHRIANGLAHGIAHVEMNIDEELFWIEELKPPFSPCILDKFSYTTR
ncbi:hypothetical protein DH2020_039583 [Rehmannia glutinosa]|uniref:CCHC-type domain-containing protein n=1 Tax=Rehmannia glutinosa TaxID=99300 RepID=A0ABR0UXM9_REHGL